MRTRMIFLLVSALMVLVAGCSQDRMTQPETDQVNTSGLINGLDPELLAVSLIRSAGWQMDPETELPERLQNLDKGQWFLFPRFTREMVTDDIAHYIFEVRTGPGEFDFFRVHRVVKEHRPYRPVRARKNVFMLPGDGAGFMAAFMMGSLSDAAPVEHALPVYLAEENVDVWGIDLAWTQVPAGTEDLSFMGEWGLQKDIDDLRLGAGIARFVRLFTCRAFGKMNLLGWSRGGMIGYACLSEESQLPRYWQQFDGYIPVDIWAKTQTYLEDECAYAADLEAMLNDGLYADDTGDFLAWMVDLARTDPDGISPVFGEPFTNMTAILTFGAQTYMVSPIPEHYSIFAGTFGADGTPTGFQFVETDIWLDFVANWAPYEPLRMEMETEWAVCGDPAHPVPFDDHLGDIQVPVFYVGANGGFGDEGFYTLSLLGSSDVTSLEVSVTGDPFTDFAHADLFNAVNAPELVWEPILGWVRDH